MLETLRRHWPEYAIEALLLALFMVIACSFTLLLEHPGSPVRHAIGSPLARRALMGLAMGTTAAALVYSPLGKRSGAHMNPAVTLAFLRLGKVAGRDAAFYVAAQIAGACAGMLVAALVAREALGEPHVNWIATLPGPRGEAAAFAAEAAISFGLMSAVLAATSRPRLERFAGLLAGTLVALWITFEAPLSGMSMNPARSFGPALSAGQWRGFWIYASAPLLGMLAAAQLHARRGPRGGCAKLHHANPTRCIFCGANA